MLNAITFALKASVVGEAVLHVATGFNADVKRVHAIHTENVARLSDLAQRVNAHQDMMDCDDALDAEYTRKVEQRRLMIHSFMGTGSSKEEAIRLCDAMARNELVFADEAVAQEYQAWQAQEVAKAEFKKEQEQAATFLFDQVAMSLGSHEAALKFVDGLKKGKMYTGEEVEEMPIFVRGGLRQ